MDDPEDDPWYCLTLQNSPQKRTVAAVFLARHFQEQLSAPDGHEFLIAMLENAHERKGELKELYDSCKIYVKDMEPVDNWIGKQMVLALPEALEAYNRHLEDIIAQHKKRGFFAKLFGR